MAGSDGDSNIVVLSPLSLVPYTHTSHAIKSDQIMLKFFVVDLNTLIVNTNLS